ncbi:PREDICTED: leiomodin-3-like isoform X2 [Amphimedon queenslandica]|uniref:Uncharacterized protein n=1 Tax=Amphimedon queenslandica TaxID=400682 RepID=A0AAN0JRR5_AMPQE|nr:PREDICTED: leiomodin-3-like isoform X2 [Amphimedon queenslandica]|eukprot:XP_019859770.1 PREDICTED: leiomodin-3-like isoform X2 [Amphimedon queenslandica]
MAVLGKIEILQTRGVKKFIVGNCIMWDATQVVSENIEGTNLLVQINDLKAALKDRDERMMAIEAELAKFKELSESKLKEIERLKRDLKESQCINVQNEEVINELKETILSLEDNEDTLNEVIEVTENDLASLKELSETRLQEIEQLKLKLGYNNKKVVWSQNSVQLTSPSVDQCIEVISELEEEHESITLKDSSSDSTQFLMPIILERGTIKGITIYSSLLSRADILSFSSQLSTNKSLTTLVLTTGSIGNNGVMALAESLQYNKTLEYLYLSYNYDLTITSVSAESLAEFLLVNTTLSCLYLDHTGMTTDGVMILMESLKTNNTLEELWLDEKHKKICTTLPYYDHIKDKLYFL